MNLRQLAEQFGVSVAILKRLLPDLFSDEMTGSTYLPPDTVHTARNAWHGRARAHTDELLIVFYTPAVPMATPLETMALWRALRVQLASNTSGTWAMAIDPFDPEGQIYAMVTRDGELVFTDRGPELHDVLLNSIRYLRGAMS